jgi:hypothetical protein
MTTKRTPTRRYYLYCAVGGAIASVMGFVVGDAAGFLWQRIFLWSFGVYAALSAIFALWKLVGSLRA